MAHNRGFTAAIVLFVGLITAGCNRQSTPPAPQSAPQTSSDYFKTPYQDESQYIVEAIVSDVAEEMYYARFHRLPDTNLFKVTAVEKPGSPLDTPVYEVEVQLDSKQAPIKSEININGPIWSPAVYKNVAAELADAAGVTVAPAKGAAEDTSLLSRLTDSQADTIEQENEKLSAALDKDFQNPQLHEKAAALLGAFLLRDHSGYFFEILSPLCRMTSHLTMAQFLNGTNAFGINGQMAEAMLLTLIGDEAPALDRLNAIGTNDGATTPFVRALWAKNTGDYRWLGGMNDLTPIESIAWYTAMADYVSTPLAWNKLNAAQQQTIDFVREANQDDYSVEMGQELSAVSVPLEIQEITNVYELTHEKPMKRDELVKVLNELPESSCFTTAAGGAVHVCIIGWGQWADFLQRHLCHAVQQTFDLLQYKWGVPEDAKEFAKECDSDFSGLRLYPFVERFDCTDIASYHKSVDDGFRVTVATPQLTPANCWNWICYDVDFAPMYRPNPNPHINEWHHHNPPPGTVYDLNPRLDHPSLTDRRDAVARFEELHQLAPYDCRIIGFILKHKYNNSPNYQQAMDLCQGLLPYSVWAMRTVANTLSDQPAKYEKLMLQAAQLDPVCYYTLGDYECNRYEPDKAALYYDKGCDADADSVRASNYSLWRVRYYLKKGDKDKARQIADAGADVYSKVGLEAEATYFELTSNYDEAFAWYQKIEDRYDESDQLIAFCERYKDQTGDTRFVPEIKKRAKKFFPNGMENVSVSDLHGAPRDGVLIEGQNGTLTSYGLKAGDVIVALNGTRTHTFNQYTYVRSLLTAPQMTLIVWQGSAYHEIKADPVTHRFGVDIGDYRPE